MADNYGEFIGVSQLHIAPITADDASSYTHGTISYLAPAASIACAPQVSVKTRYYDNNSYYTTTTEGETKVTLVISGLSTKQKATLLGKKYSTNSKKMYDAGNTDAPYFALSFKADVEGGAKYYWFMKGKFSNFNEEAETKTTDINEKTTTLEFTAIATAHTWNIATVSVPEVKPLKLIEADSREDSALSDATWFADIPEPNPT